MFCEKHDKINYDDVSSMAEFLSSHFRYDTMNSWNRSTSYANNVKLYNLGIPSEYMDMAYELTSGEIDMDDYSFSLNTILNEFRAETGYAILFNGRSAGYLVLYETVRKPDKTLGVCVGKSIDEYHDKEDFEEWDIDELRERTKLVVKFDETCDRIRTLFINTLKDYHIEEETITVPKTVKYLRPNDDE